MKQTTITEALAELKTIDKRILKKREFIGSNILRPEMVKDPLEKDGGSVTAIQRERQAIADLEQDKVNIRRAIAEANGRESITVEGKTRTISDWLVWRRDIAPSGLDFLKQLSNAIKNQRSEALKRGGQVIVAGSSPPDRAPVAFDIVVNVSEQELSTQIEGFETVLGTLDGQLSLKNATITIEY